MLLALEQAAPVLVQDGWLCTGCIGPGKGKDGFGAGLTGLRESKLTSDDMSLMVYKYF